MKDQAEYRAVTVGLTHQTALGVEKLKVDRLVIAETNLKSIVTRLEGDIRKSEAKGK